MFDLKEFEILAEAAADRFGKDDGAVIQINQALQEIKRLIDAQSASVKWIKRLRTEASEAREIIKAFVEGRNTQLAATHFLIKTDVKNEI